MSQISFQWLLALTHTLAHARRSSTTNDHLLSLSAATSILHTIMHQFSNRFLQIVKLLTISMSNLLNIQEKIVQLLGQRMIPRYLESQYFANHSKANSSFQKILSRRIENLSIFLLQKHVRTLTSSTVREVRSQAEGSLRELRIPAGEYICSLRTIF